MNPEPIHSSAYQAGYFIGGIIGIAFFLGLLAFSIFALIQAFRKRTTGWIIAGCFGGLVLLTPILLVTVGMAVSFVSSWRESRGGSAVLRNAGMQTMRGTDFAYSLNVPTDWTIRRKTQDFDTLAHRRSIYIGVIAEEANLGDPQTIAKLARHRIEEVGTDIRWSDPEPLVLDGRNWLQFTVDCRVENIPVSYRFFVYSGPEGTFQIIGWTMQEFFARDDPQMRKWMQTFHFPAGKAQSLH